MNAMILINPYKLDNSFWVFDDEKVGLTREPFVLGMSEIIDESLSFYFNKEEIKTKETEGIDLLFSVNKFPKYQFELTKLKDELEGAWYSVKNVDGFEYKTKEGWLCPALNLYIPTHPDKLYASIS